MFAPLREKLLAAAGNLEQLLVSESRLTFSRLCSLYRREKGDVSGWIG